MNNQPFFSELSGKLLENLPNTLKSFKNEIENHVYASLHKTITELNIVTREEFDIQTAVLLKTRLKLDKLQKMVDEMQISRAVPK